MPENSVVSIVLANDKKNNLEIRTEQIKVCHFQTMVTVTFIVGFCSVLCFFFCWFHFLISLHCLHPKTPAC